MKIFRTFDGSVCVTSDTRWRKSIRDLMIKNRITNYLKNSYLLDKVFSFSLDNATTNTRAIGFLKEDSNLSLLLDGSILHVRFCAYIINLFVQEGIAQLQSLLEPIRSIIKWISISCIIKRAYKIKCEERGLRKKCGA
ncbi:putative AC transposase [Bienertia sinuspersici]